MTPKAKLKQIRHHCIAMSRREGEKERDRERKKQRERKRETVCVYMCQDEKNPTGTDTNKDKLFFCLTSRVCY